MIAAVPLRVVAPVATAYAVFLAIAAVSARAPVERRRGSPLRAGWRPFLIRLARTAGGGYATFLLIVVVFHVGIAGQHGAMRNAIPGGALLAFGVAIPAFVVLTWLEHALRHRSS